MYAENKRALMCALPAACKGLVQMSIDGKGGKADGFLDP